MCMALRALIFDVDGTLADTEMAHLQAFNTAFAEHGCDWSWDVPTYTELLRVTGGKERIVHFGRHVLAGEGPNPIDDPAWVAQVHGRKTELYTDMVASGEVSMRPGVIPLIEAAAAAEIPMAIATTTSPANIDALLTWALGSQWRTLFQVVEDAHTAPCKKPDPSVYRQALRRLDVPPGHSVAFEDSENGLRAALGAEIPTIVTPNVFTATQDFSGAAQVVPSLADVTLAQIESWCDFSLCVSPTSAS